MSNKNWLILAVGAFAFWYFFLRRSNVSGGFNVGLSGGNNAGPLPPGPSVNPSQIPSGYFPGPVGYPSGGPPVAQAAPDGNSTGAILQGVGGLIGGVGQATGSILGALGNAGVLGGGSTSDSFGGSDPSLGYGDVSSYA